MSFSEQRVCIWDAHGRPSVQSCPWGLAGSALKFCQGHRVLMPGHTIAIKWELPWLLFLNSLLARNPGGVRTEGGGEKREDADQAPYPTRDLTHAMSPGCGGGIRLTFKWWVRLCAVCGTGHFSHWVKPFIFAGKNENSQQTSLYLILKEVRDNGSQK